MITHEEKLEVKLEFRISKAKVFPVLALIMLPIFGSIYVLCYSKQVSLEVFIAILTTTLLLALILIIRNLAKTIKYPVIIIDSNGIYHKAWGQNVMPWSNVRFIWSRSYWYPRRLYVETIDQSPSELPRFVMFSALTPGFNEAWNHIKVYHPEKLEGTSRFC